MPDKKKYPELLNAMGLPDLPAAPRQFQKEKMPDLRGVERPIAPLKNEYHPKGLAESYIEKMVKGASEKYGEKITPDDPYLEQYLHPDYDILGKQTLRPSKRKPDQFSGYEWREPATNISMVSKPEDIERAVRAWNEYTKKNNLSKEDINSGKKMNAFLDTQPIPEYLSKGPNLAGLGHFKFDESNPNYDSIYDVWDFDTKSPITSGQVNPNKFFSMENMAKAFMQHIGKPFNVYARYPKGQLRGTGTEEEGEVNQSPAAEGSDLWYEQQEAKKKKVKK